MIALPALAVALAAALLPTVSAHDVDGGACPYAVRPFEYVGCFAESDPNTLAFRSNANQYNMTHEQCFAVCKGNGFRYSGLEYYGICFCGNAVQGPQVDDSQCTFGCSGDKSQTCGGDDRISVYKDTTWPEISPYDVSDYTSLGCMYDNSPSGRALPYPASKVFGSGMTTEVCTAACKAGGYPYAGTQYSSECWCGLTLGPDAYSTPDDCNMPCAANSSQACGGPARLSVYFAKDMQSGEPCGSYNPELPEASVSTVPSVGSTPISSAEPTPTPISAVDSTPSSAEEVVSTVAPITEEAIPTSTEAVDPVTLPVKVLVSPVSASSTSSASLIAETASSSIVSSISSASSTKSSSSSASTTSSSTSSSSTSSTTSTLLTTSRTSTSSSTSSTTSATPTTTTVSSTGSTSTSKPATTTSSSTVSSTSSTTSKPATTTAPTTTSTATTSSTSSICYATSTIPSTCEYQCGSWCNMALPDFSDSTGCQAAASSCRIQLASCFIGARWPAAMDCFSYGSWCSALASYCRSKTSGLSKADAYSRNAPSGLPATTTKVQVSCSATSTAATSTKKTTTTSATPNPTKAPIPLAATNICKQPTDNRFGYAPGNPVGGIDLPLVTCNDLKADWTRNPFKLYTSADSANSASYPSSRVPAACADACQAQYNQCVGVYAESNRQPGSKGKGASLWDSWFGQFGRLRRGLEVSELQRRAGAWSDTYNGAASKCKAQYDDCVSENRYTTGSGKCGAWGSGW